MDSLASSGVSVAVAMESGCSGVACAAEAGTIRRALKKRHVATCQDLLGGGAHAALLVSATCTESLLSQSSDFLE